MEVIVSIDRHGHGIVTIPLDVSRKSPSSLKPSSLETQELKPIVSQVSLPDRHLSIGIIERNELAPLVRNKVKANGMPCPHGRNQNTAQNLHFTPY
jgi:hypothetical protein